MIVMPDADLDQAADALVGAPYGSAGERQPLNRLHPVAKIRRHQGPYFRLRLMATLTLSILNVRNIIPYKQKTVTDMGGLAQMLEIWAASGQFFGR